MSRPAEEALFHVLSAGGEIGRDLDRIERQGKRAFEKRLTGPRSGHVYTTLFFTAPNGAVVPYGIRPPHQASAPGQPPALDTGHLLRHVKVEAFRTPSGGHVSITSSAEYGPYLEKGTSKMLPRPWFTPTVVEDIIPAVRKELKEGIESRERRAAREMGGKG